MKGNISAKDRKSPLGEGMNTLGRVGKGEGSAPLLNRVPMEV